MVYWNMRNADKSVRPKVLYALKSGEQEAEIRRMTGTGLCTADALEDAEIVITDSEETARKMEQAGKFVVGCQAAGENFFDGASLVMEVPSDIGPEDILDAYDRSLGLPVEILRTNRLIVRESCQKDYEAIRRMSDEAHHDGMLSVIPEDGFDEYLAYIRTAYRFFGFGLWTVEKKDSGRIIGRCGLMPKADEISPEGRIEIGYLIARDQRGRGYAEEACRAILSFAFRDLECTEVFARIDPSNIASLTLAEKLGFLDTGKRTDEGKLILLRLKRRSAVSARNPHSHI